MLPIEAFAEVIAFLRLFDLNALAVTNATCSSLAVKASTSMRWEEFPGLEFATWDLEQRSGIAVRDSSSQQLIAHLTFPSEHEITEFVAAAFPNCVFENLVVWFRKEQLLEALAQVASSVIVKGVLRLATSMSPDDSRKLVRKFRKVKALFLEREVTDEEAHELAIFYRESGVEELWYHRSFKDSKPEEQKIF